MKNKKIAATILILLVSVSGVYLARALKPDPETVLKRRLFERSLGSEKSPIWVTEYVDYQCPPCARANVLLKEMMTKYPDKIYLQARYFPLPAHAHALKAAVYAECAARQEKGAFWKLHEALFSHQAQWAKDNYAQIQFASFAKKADLNLKTLDACVADPEVEKYVLDEKRKGSEIGVQITPTFFVNGKILVGVNALTQELQALLGETG